MRHAWRGCLGLAALLDRVEDTFYHGDKCLIENDHVTWLALRDRAGRAVAFHRRTPAPT